MLIKIHDIEFNWQWDNDLKLNVPHIENTTEVWINPERVSFVYPRMRINPEMGLIKCGGERYNVSHEDAQRIIDHINGKAEPPAAATPPAADDTLVHLDEMKLDSFYSKTAQAHRRMWRCTSKEGISFNIFDHVDHRNTYKLFQDANLDLWMDNMQHGDTLDWQANPIPVFVRYTGEFYNPVRVGYIDQVDHLKPVHFKADESEDDDG